MKKYVLIIVAIALPLTTLSFMWFSHNRQRQVQEWLWTAARTAGVGDSIPDYGEFVRSFKGVRVTVLDGGGTVLADNRANSGEMGSHADRPEFVQAAATGFGDDIRRSETTGRKAIYVAVRLKSGVYVRLSQSVELTWEFLLWLFAPVVFLSTCLAAVMYIFAKNKQLEKMRHEFVANVSHELKTPLTSIKGFAELTTSGLISDINTVMEYQQRIVTQSDRLLATINDILHLSKLESAKPKSLMAVDTRSVAEQVREALKHVADRKDIIIQVSGNGWITAEVEPIYQMIYNLVDNGIKYGKSGGFVKVALNDNRITVSDNGIGIPPNDIDRVFERFYRVDKSRSLERGGTGLGLAIVKHTVQRYNGTVTLKSGDGTQVYVEFKK